MCTVSWLIYMQNPKFDGLSRKKLSIATKATLVNRTVPKRGRNTNARAAARGPQERRPFFETLLELYDLSRLPHL